MAIQLPKLTPARIIAILSLLLNILGGTGTIQPLVGDHDDVCPAPTPARASAHEPAPPPPALDAPSN